MEKIFASMLIPAREHLRCDPTERISKHYVVKSKIKTFLFLSVPLLRPVCTDAQVYLSSKYVQ